MSEIWSSIVKSLEGKLDPKELKTWFAPTRQVAFEDIGNSRVAVTVSVPSPVFADWIRGRHGDLLAREAAAAGFPDLDFRFQAAAVEIPASAVPVPASPAPPRGLVLNPRFTFDSFVVGSSNQFAHAAARAVAESPSRSYNPLFLYGGVGLGKTHLVHAIAHEVVRRSPGMKVMYLSAERFLNELINALRFERMHEFKSRYRELDVLLMDDIQFIAGKDSTQEEFFHTFNALHDAQKQIVVTSDALPKEIPTLEERLRSRFEWGLIADIQPPDLEMKVAIIRKKAAAEKAEIPNDVALFIAGTVKSNVRELEGRVNRVLAFSSLTGKPVSVELAKETLRDILGHEENRAIPLGNPENGGFALRAARLGSEGENEREADLVSAPGRHVPVPEADRAFVSRDRPALQRQAPLDGHALGREDRKTRRGRPRFPQGDRGVPAAVPLVRAPRRAGFPRVAFPHPAPGPEELRRVLDFRDATPRDARTR